MKEELHHCSSIDEMGGPWCATLQLDHSDWRAAQEWLFKTEASILPIRDNTIFFVPSHFTMNCSLPRDGLKECCKNWKAKQQPFQHEDFDAYWLRRAAFYEVKPLKQCKQKSCFVQYSCSCPQYFRRAFCKHSIAIGIFTKRFVAPLYCK
jgi:hypothetical protein